ncbi:MAG: hypothetical protein IJ449_13955 [Clostridia bacterium]|nr:hypothetical protein [Clostridia bacterium]
MPTSDVEVLVEVFSLSDYYKDYYDITGPGFLFATTVTWYINPTWELTDLIAMCWSDEFTIYDTYAYGYGIKDGYSTSSYLEDSSFTLKETTPETGVEWAWNLKLDVVESEGVICAIVGLPSGSSGSANLCGGYAHTVGAVFDLDAAFSDKSISFTSALGMGFESAVPDVIGFSY